MHGGNSRGRYIAGVVLIALCLTASQQAIAQPAWAPSAAVEIRALLTDLALVK